MKLKFLIVNRNAPIVKLKAYADTNVFPVVMLFFIHPLCQGNKDTFMIKNNKKNPTLHLLSFYILPELRPDSGFFSKTAAGFHPSYCCTNANNQHNIE